MASPVSFLNYFCPFSKVQGSSWKEFKGNLSTWKKIVTVAASFLATIATLPLFGLGGLATFRVLVGRLKKIEVTDPNSNLNKTASNINQTTVGNPPSTDTGQSDTDPIKDPEPKSDPTKEKTDGEDMLIRDHSVFKTPVLAPPRRSIDDSEIGMAPCRRELFKRAGFYLTEEKTLDTLNDGEMNAYVTEIKKNLPLKMENSNFLKNAHRQFMREAKKAEEEALKLHQEFKERYAKEGQAPAFDGNKRIATSTLFQLKMAIRIAKEKFPGLTSLAFNEEQNLAVAKLIQMIICGNEIKEFPFSSSCFELSELKGKHSEPNILKLETNGRSYLHYLLAIREENKDQADLGVLLKRNFKNALHSFAQDCLDRHLNLLKIPGEENLLPLGKMEDRASFVNTMKMDYLEYLQSNPQTIPSLVKAHKNSPVFNSIVSGGITGFFGSVISLIKERFTKAIEEEKKQWGSNQKVLEALQHLIDYSTINHNTIKKIAKASGCSENEIESLVLIKLIEMIILMNQSNQTHTFAVIDPQVRAYGESALLSPKLVWKPTQAMFLYPDSSYQSLHQVINSQILMNSEVYGSEQVREYFSPALPVAEVVSEEEMKDFNTSNSGKTVTAVTNLRLSWKGSEGAMDHLVSMIDPLAVENKAQLRFPILKEEMKKASEGTLKKLAALPREESVYGQVWKTLAGFILPNDQDHFEDIIEIAKALGHTLNTCREFMRAAAICKAEKSEVVPVLNTFREALSDAYTGLKKMHTRCAEKNEQEKCAALEHLFSLIEQMLTQLPVGEEALVENGYLDRFYNLFSQSNEEVAISWKVRKYEKQISELKALFEKEFKKVLKEPSLSDSMITDGWAETGDGSLTRDLYGVLSGVEINNLDKARFTQEHLKEVRDTYVNFLKKLRSAGKDSEEAQKIAALLFTEINLQEEAFATLELFDKMGAQILGQAGLLDPKVEGESDNVKRIYTLYKRIGVVPYSAKAPLLDQLANSARGQFNRDFDPYIQGNPTHLLYGLRIGERTILALGMGTPTIEDRRSNVKLNPEFVQFIKGYKKQGKRHLYVNNQNLIPKTDWLSYVMNGDETGRGNLIMQAQELDELKGALYAISLSKNSKFYSQKGEYEHQNKADIFKTSLYEEVFVKKPRESGCYIPATIRTEIPDFDNKAKTIIDRIHLDLFEGRGELSAPEREVFIEVFYDNLVKLILIEGNMSSLNLSCKDQIDRGAGSNAQFYADCAISEFGGELPNFYTKTIEALMLVRALFVRKRPPLPERVERFAEGYDFFLKHAEKMKILRENLFPGVVITPA